jgi:type IV pilus assembly protein PilW
MNDTTTPAVPAHVARGRAHRLRLQAGRTLVELMIAATVALTVMSALIAVYIGTARAFRVAGELASIADSGQVAMYLIGDSIRQAGYGEIVGSDLTLGAPQVGTYRSQTLFAAGSSLAGCSGARFVDETSATPVCGAALDPAFDTLMVRFQGDAVIPPPQGRIDDCLGTQVPNETLPANHVGSALVAGRPMILNVYYGLTDALWCRGNGRATEDAPFAAAQQMVSNVEQFKVFYGFDDLRYANPAVSPVSSVRSIRDATWLNGRPAATMPWDFVVTVHVCMLIRSAPAAGGSLNSAASSTYARCPMTAAEAAGAAQMVTASDGVVRRMYSQAFTVRSRSSANPLQFLPL